jgi:ParB/RepB/Spo0J family partition protein
MGRVPHDDHIEDEVADMEAESPPPDNRLSAVESATMTGGSLEILSCPVSNADGKKCKMTRGHTGYHLAYGGASWGSDDGKRCGAVDGRRGKACILDQDHDGAHSDGGRTWPNKPAKRPRAEAAAPPVPAAPADPGRFEPALRVADIRRSPHNHRRVFKNLEELGESIRVKGLINPITVRPALFALDGKGKADPAKWELVAGERRWRAAELAGVETLPAMVRDLSDVEIKEIQLIENVQRDDVHQLEEADGYRDLIENHGYTVERIAEKTGKSKATIYARLKLCDLAAEAREVFLADRLQPSIALLIARIPDEALQGKALRAVLGDPGDDDLDDANLWERPHFEVLDDKGHTRAEPIPMSVREAAAYIQRKFMLRLEDASFDPANAELVPAAGACNGCVHRTGNQPTLFNDVKGADVCTKPPCYQAKTDASWALRAQAARAAGLKVLDRDASEKIFNSYGDPTKVVRTAPFVDPKAEVPYELRGDHDGKPPTWEKLLGKKGIEKAKSVLAQDGTGAGRMLLDKKSATAIAVELGKVEKPAGGAGLSDAEKKRRAKAAREQAVEGRALEIALDLFNRKGAEPLPAKKEAAIWGWLATVVLTSADSYSTDDPMLVRRQRGIEVGEEVDICLDSLVEGKVGPEARGLLVEWAAATARSSERWLGGRGKQWAKGLELFGIDWKKLLAEAAKQLDAEARGAGEKPAKATKKGAKKR